MSKVIAIATNLVLDSELFSPKRALEKAGNQVDIAEEKPNKVMTSMQITGKPGKQFKSTKSIDDVKLNDYDALFIPGGFSPDQLRIDDRYVNFVKQFILSNKPIFAICHGPQMFIQSGLANRLIVTAWQSVRNDLYYAGATVKNAPLVIDHKHNIITSRYPGDLKYFNKAAVNALK